ncbi:MAG: cytidine deaminase, partial [Chlorobi bacterium]|nr:cytidine deaminase [Chlorobiota bacterium]
MRTKELRILVYEYDNIVELPEIDRMLVLQAREASRNAYAPYSNFKVGAALLLDNGESVTGNNQENSAYPSGICAERVALFYANANFPDNKVKILAVTACNKNGLTTEP